MKKWYAEEYEFQIEVTGFLRGNSTERCCRNGEEIGDRYTCTYGCPVNADGQGICSKTMLMMFPAMEATPSTSVAASPAMIATTSSAIWTSPIVSLS